MPISLIVILLSIGTGAVINSRQPLPPPSTNPTRYRVVAQTTGPASPPFSEKCFSGLKLQAILKDDLHPSLLINGQLFHLGDEIEGARIVSVESNRVTLDKNGRHFLLRLGRE
jgi:hypothetical protein